MVLKINKDTELGLAIHVSEIRTMSTGVDVNYLPFPPKQRGNKLGYIGRTPYTEMQVRSRCTYADAFESMSSEVDDGLGKGERVGVGTKEKKIEIFFVLFLANCCAEACRWLWNLKKRCQDCTSCKNVVKPSPAKIFRDWVQTPSPKRRKKSCITYFAVRFKAALIFTNVCL